MAFPKCTSASLSGHLCPLRPIRRRCTASPSALSCRGVVAQRSGVHRTREGGIGEWGWCKQRGEPLYAAFEGAPPSPDPGASEGGQPNMELVKICIGLCLGAGLCTAGVMFASHLGALASGVASGATPKGLSAAAQGAWAGLSAGCLHTLAGPDHLAGLAPLTIGQNKFIATAMGSLWGFGHSSAQLCLGLIFILLKERFKSLMPALSTWSGAVVGITLIAIGVLGIFETLNPDEEEVETHAVGEEAKVLQAAPQRRIWGTYLMGFVHGLQPDSLYLVLPALALPTRLAAAAYVSMFVAGTILSMGGYCLAIGTASEAAREKPWLARNLPTITGTIAIIVGLAVLLNGIGVQDSTNGTISGTEDII